MIQTIVTEVPPNPFFNGTQVAGAFLLVDGEFLMLQRHEQAPSPLLWCLPAGKVEKGESLLVAVRREVEEETGIALAINDFTQIHTLYVQKPSEACIFHIFLARLIERPSIYLSSHEHIDYCWCTMEESLKLDLIEGGKQSLELCIPYLF